MPAARC